MGCPAVMGPCCLSCKEEVVAAIKGLKKWNSSWSYWCSEGYDESFDGVGTRWVTDLINNIAKEGCISDDCRNLVPCTRGKRTHLCAVHT